MVSPLARRIVIGTDIYANTILRTRKKNNVAPIALANSNLIEHNLNSIIVLIEQFLKKVVSCPAVNEKELLDDDDDDDDWFWLLN